MEKKISKLKIIVLNPFKDWGEGVFHQAQGSNKGTQTKLSYYSQNLMRNKGKVTKFSKLTPGVM